METHGYSCFKRYTFLWEGSPFANKLIYFISRKITNHSLICSCRQLVDNVIYSQATPKCVEQNITNIKRQKKNELVIRITRTLNVDTDPRESGQNLNPFPVHHSIFRAKFSRKVRNCFLHFGIARCVIMPKGLLYPPARNAITIAFFFLRKNNTISGICREW